MNSDIMKAEDRKKSMLANLSASLVYACGCAQGEIHLYLKIGFRPLLDFIGESNHCESTSGKSNAIQRGDRS